jgi:catechol 2,3-dioxygenase-like lactoylglutathione lyase family enzyme
LLAFDVPGAAYPIPCAANDPWFQHFAINVSDMAAADAQLSRYSRGPISVGGPQLLAPSTGSVTAYKFRDPEGHPLELSFNPAAAGATGAATSSNAASVAKPFIGIDHTAIVVADPDASIAFYTKLGFRLTKRLVNTGPEQDRLDGLVDVELDIIVLTAAAGPHLELLRYRRPLPGPPVEVAPSDIAATRLVLSGTGEVGRRRDPDGHWLELV